MQIQISCPIEEKKTRPETAYAFVLLTDVSESFGELGHSYSRTKTKKSKMNIGNA
jgi:hypothetical protein